LVDIGVATPPSLAQLPALPPGKREMEGESSKCEV